MANDRDWCEGCKAIRANVDIYTGLCAPCIKRQAEEDFKSKNKKNDITIIVMASGNHHLKRKNKHGNRKYQKPSRIRYRTYA